MLDYENAGKRGDFVAAARYAQGSIDLARLYGEKHNPFLLYSVERLGTDYEARRNFKAALNTFEEQLKLANSSDGTDSKAFAAALVNIGRIYKKQREFITAEPYFRQALGIYKNIQKGAEAEMADTLDFLAWTVGNQGRYNEASEFYQQELAITKHLYGEKCILNCNALVGLAWVQEKKGSYKEALPFLEQAYALTKAPKGFYNAWLTVSLTTLANIYRDHHEYKKAQYVYDFVLAMSDRTLFLQNNLFKADMMQNYAKLLHEIGKEVEANKLELAAKKIRQ